MTARPRMPSLLRSLSARLLVLTVLFVMLSEVLIFAPSAGRFRLTYLEERSAGRLHPPSSRSWPRPTTW